MTPQRAIQCPQRKMQMLSFVKTGGGTPDVSGSCADFISAVTDNGPGDYTFTFNSNVVFTQKPEIICTSNTALRIPVITTVTALAFRVMVTDESGALADGDFNCMVLGSLATDLLGPPN